MKIATNRREFTRVPIQLEVEVTSALLSMPSKGCRIRDVSLNGLYLQCENPLPTGSSCQVMIALGGGKEPVRIQVNGTVARTDANGMGLEISEIVGAESFGHLQNLVRYNSSTTEQIGQVEREFSEHLGIRRKRS